LLNEATVHDWGGEVVRDAPDRLNRYKTAGNVRGDHPLDLGACSLGFNAYALTGEAPYRDWVLAYAGAWRDRILENGGNIPTNIGLDGTIGGEWGGEWSGRHVRLELRPGGERAELLRAGRADGPGHCAAADRETNRSANRCGGSWRICTP
jgi:hypothetical protein